MFSWLRPRPQTLTEEFNPRTPAGERAIFGLLTVGLVTAAAVAIVQPWRALALVVALIIVYVALTRPHELLLVLAVYTPFEPFLLKFVPDDLYLYARYFTEGIIYLLLAVAAIRRLSRGQKPVATPLDLPFLGFLLVAAASLVVNDVPAVYGLLGLRQIIRFMLLFFAAVNLEIGPRFTKRLIAVMFGVLVFQAGLGVVQAAAGGSLDSYLIPSERRFFESIQLTSGTTQFWSPGTRVFATMGRYDQLGTFLSFFMLLALGLYYVYRGEKAARRYGWLVLLGLPALFLTMSRASWFGFLLGLLFVGAWIKKDVRIRLSFVAAIVGAVLYLAWSGINVSLLTEYRGQTPVERLFESFSYERWRGEYYGLGRLYWFVQTPLVVVRSSPVLGVGPGQYGGGAVAALGNTAVYDRLNLPFGVYGTDGYIDNNWFSVWGETGTLGLFFYAWMVFALWRLGLTVYQKSRDKFLRGLALGYSGAVMAVTFQAFLATYLEVRTLALYLWVVGAAIYCWARRDKIFE